MNQSWCRSLEVSLLLLPLMTADVLAFVICLKTRTAFTFFVDVFGNAE